MQTPVRPLQDLATVRTLLPALFLGQILELLALLVLLADTAVLRSPTRDTSSGPAGGADTEWTVDGGGWEESRTSL